MCSYRNCNKFCKGGEYTECSKRLLRTAQACNGCPEMKSCRKRKLVYDAQRAQGDRTPFEVFEFLYGEGTAAKLHTPSTDWFFAPRIVTKNQPLK